MNTMSESSLSVTMMDAVHLPFLRNAFLRNALEEIIPVLAQQYIPMMWRKRIRNALVVLSSKCSAHFLSDQQRVIVNVLLLKLALFFDDSKKTITVNVRRQMYHLFQSITGALQQCAAPSLEFSAQQNPPASIEAIAGLIDRVVPKNVNYSVVSIGNQRTVVSIDAEKLAESVENDLQREMEALNLTGKLDVVYKRDGQALDRCRTEYSLVSGAPVKKYKTTEDLKFVPSGTVGTFVAMLPTLSLQGDSSDEESIHTTEEFTEDYISDEQLGFITAQHVAEMCSLSVKGLGSPLPDATGADICVVMLSKEWLAKNTCQNLVEFPDTDSLTWLWGPERQSLDSSNSAMSPRCMEYTNIDDNIFGVESAVVSSWNELLELPYDDNAIYRAGMQVFKMGSVTGWTMGTFLGFYIGEAFNHSRLSLLIEWCPNMKFADNGDCGSVYYCCSEGKNIPLAVHVGSARYENKDVSIGAPLKDFQLDGYTISYEIKRHPCFVQFDRTDHTEILDGVVKIAANAEN